MVLPSLNLHRAVAGGLGRFAFCCGVASCCAKARQVAMRIKATEIAVRFFKMIFFKVFLLRNVRIIIMSVYEEKREELERYEFMMGKARGRLAVSLDSLTDALVLVGQHGVYCQSSRQPGKPAMDVQLILKCLNDSKELISSVMKELQNQADSRR